MDFLEFIFEFLFEELPRRVAVAICAGLATVIAIVGFAVRGHYHSQVAACNSVAGHFAQAFSGGATVHCGFASFMSKAGLIVGVIGVIAVVAFGAWLIKLLTTPPAQTEAT